MREIIKKLLGIEPMTKDEKESVSLCILVCTFMFTMFYLIDMLG